MKTKIYRKSLVGFLAMFGETFGRKCERPSGSTSSVYFASDEFEPRMLGGVADGRLAEPKDFDEIVHTVFKTNLEKLPNVQGLVVFENLDMSSSQLGQRTAIMVGEGYTYLNVAAVREQHLGDVPSIHQWPVAAYVRDDSDWDEIEINGEVHRELLCPGEETVRDLDKMCLRAVPDLGKDEKVFDKDVKFADGKRMAIQVIASDQSVLPKNEELDPCWTQGVLFDKDGNELGRTEVGGTFSGEYIVEHDDNRYIVTVPELPSESTAALVCHNIKWDMGDTDLSNLPCSLIMTNVPLELADPFAYPADDDIGDVLASRYKCCFETLSCVWAADLLSSKNLAEFDPEIGPDMEIVDWNKP